MTNSIMKNISLIGAAGLLLIAAPLAVFAQAGVGTPPLPVPPPTNPNGAPITSGGGIIAFINIILGWVATIFWIFAVIFIFYAAFLYLTAAGDETKVEKASHTLLYAVIAIAVGLLAYGLPLLVGNVLGGH